MTVEKVLVVALVELITEAAGQALSASSLRGAP